MLKKREFEVSWHDAIADEGCTTDEEGGVIIIGGTKEGPSPIGGKAGWLIQNSTQAWDEVRIHLFTNGEQILGKGVHSKKKNGNVKFLLQGTELWRITCDINDLYGDFWPISGMPGTTNISSGWISSQELDLRGDVAITVEAEPFTSADLCTLALRFRRSVAAADQESCKAMERYKILFISAEPTDLERIRSNEEFREINDRLRMSSHRRKFELYPSLAARPYDLSQALLDVQPQIVHVAGHGRETGALMVEDSLGSAFPIDPLSFAHLLSKFADTVECVIINTCFSEKHAIALSEHIRFAVGIRTQIPDFAAIAFSVGFYQALAAGKSIKHAFDLGISQVKLRGEMSSLPVLFFKKNA